MLVRKLNLVKYESETLGQNTEINNLNFHFEIDFSW